MSFVSMIMHNWFLIMNKHKLCPLAFIDGAEINLCKGILRRYKTVSRVLSSKFLVGFMTGLKQSVLVNWRPARFSY
jgi:hypothetical protein